ncbi:MAG: cation:dicarboxylase symporter family transporter, partial [Acidobacteria bacterium]|nr:cation:dicarboxylase symporter family transporter [Acidobacteriota bacterium]
MTVLPYLVLALVIGFGQLEPGEARRLAVRAGAILLATWVVTLAVIAALPATFPEVQSASFFSTSLVQPPEPFSVPDLYFTSNPFHSLANAVVPAVVLFSSMLGVALMRVDGRERLLDTLRVLDASVVSITRFVVGLTPLGVFAIAAVTAGTTTLETVVRLQVYLVAFVAASLLLAFWILPLLVTATTPFTYREVVGVARDALLTAFVTGNAFIVLPILVERSNALLRERGLLTPDSDSAAEVLVPIFFNFPNGGPLLTLLFVPFAAWLAGDALSATDYPALFAIGVPAYFANAHVALPFLLDVFGLPHDLFQLYVPTTVLTGKFNALASAMNLLVFALLGGAAMGGFLVKDRRRFLRAGAAMAAGVVVVAAGVWLALGSTVDTTYRKDEALRRMHAPRRVYSAIVHRDLQSVSAEGALKGPRTLASLEERGTLRIGYDPVNPPLSFFNLDDELVGLDVELSAALAADLGLEAEFIPVRWGDVPSMLADGVIDIMPSIWYRPFWFSSVRLSEPYMVGTVGLVVRDDRRHEFARVDGLRRGHGLRVGVPLDVTQLDASIRRYFDDGEVELVPLENALPFLEGRRPDLDAFLMPAETGAAATLLHPEFTVVVPQPDPVRLPFAFGLPLDSRELTAAVNEWIVFVRGTGRTKRAYDYWVLGQGAESKEPRWSIARNVLGWKMR